MSNSVNSDNIGVSTKNINAEHLKKNDLESHCNTENIFFKGGGDKSCTKAAKRKNEHLLNNNIGLIKSIKFGNASNNLKFKLRKLTENDDELLGTNFSADSESIQTKYENIFPSVLEDCVIHSHTDFDESCSFNDVENNFPHTKNFSSGINNDSNKIDNDNVMQNNYEIQKNKTNPLSLLSWTGSVKLKKKIKFIDSMNNIRKVISQKKSGRIPFNVNKWTILSLYVYITFATSLIHWGWVSGLRELLVIDDAYSWLCTPDELRNAGSSHQPKCAEQKMAIDTLWTVGYVSQFVFSIVGGYSLDKIGSLKSCIYGVALKVIGWILLAYSCKEFPMYILSFVLIAGSTDLSFLPFVTVANLFPLKQKSIVVALLGAAKSTSCSIPIIMYKIYSADELHFANQMKRGIPSNKPKFFTFIIGYIICGLGISFLLILLFVPRKTFSDYNSNRVKKKCERGVCGDANRNNRIIDLDQSMRTTKENSGDISSSLYGDGTENSVICDFDILSEDDTLSYYRSTNNLSDLCQSQDGHELSMELNSIEKCKAEKLNLGCKPAITEKFFEPQSRNSTRFSSAMSKIGMNLKSFCQATKKICILFNNLRFTYKIMLLFFSFSLLRNEFIMKTIDIQIPLMYSFWGEVLSPLRFFPCVLFGVITDFFGVHTTLFILNSFGILMYLFPIFNGAVFQYMTAASAFCYTSFILSSMYSYILITQPSKHFGKLSGFASCVAGLFTLLSIGMVRAPLLIINIVFVVIGVLLCFFLFGIYLLDKPYIMTRLNSE